MDLQSWARVFARLGQWEKAWGLISKTIPPHELQGSDSGNEEFLKSEWNNNPQNSVNTQRWVEWLHGQQRIEERDQVLIQAAKLPNSPLWFRQKAAQIFAAQKQYSEAVSLLIAL